MSKYASIGQAVADWRAACDRYDEVSRCYVALDRAPAPAKPDALRPRPDDDRYLRFSLEIAAGRASRDAYDDRLVDELRYFRDRGMLFWSDFDPALVKGRERAEEVIAAGDAWRKEIKKRVQEIRDLEDLLGQLIVPADEAAARIIAAPPSIEALSLKLDVLSRHLESGELEDAVDTHSGDPVAVAAAIALDVLTMNRAGVGGIEAIAVKCQESQTR